MSDALPLAPIDATPQEAAVLVRISNGETTASACNAEGLSVSAFYARKAARTSLEESFVRASRIGGEIMGDQLLTVYDREKDTNKARGISDNLRWWLSRRHRQVFGDTLDINVTQTVDIDAAMRAADARVLATLRPVSDQRDTITDLLPNESGTYAVRTTDSQSVDADPDIFS